jgi:hypothetical protein
MSKKHPPLKWFDGYDIRKGGDGRMGIYDDYNVRLATFNANTAPLQTRLKLLFERAHDEKWKAK